MIYNKRIIYKMGNTPPPSQVFQPVTSGFQNFGNDLTNLGNNIQNQLVNTGTNIGNQISSTGWKIVDGGGVLPIFIYYSFI